MMAGNTHCNSGGYGGRRASTRAAVIIIGFSCLSRVPIRVCYDNRSDEPTASKTEVKSQRQRAHDDAEAAEAGPRLAGRTSHDGAARGPLPPEGSLNLLGIATTT